MRIGVKVLVQDGKDSYGLANYLHGPLLVTGHADRSGSRVLNLHPISRFAAKDLVLRAQRILRE
jgi:hypothetical protein